jgi:hypothetical protein
MKNYLIVECLECSEVFRKQDFHEENSKVFCKCKNLEIGIKKNENSTYSFYVAVTYSKSRPRIYESNKTGENEE